MSLLEIMVSTAILGLIVTAAAVSVRTSQGVFNDYGGDAAKLDAAHATALHLVRQLRQCTSIGKMSDPSETDGFLAAFDTNGNTLVWTAGSGNVMFGIDPASDLLSSGITSLVFTGYEADGTTTTTTLDDIHSVEFTVGVTLDRDVDANRTIRSRVWLRAW